MEVFVWFIMANITDYYCPKIANLYIDFEISQSLTGQCVLMCHIGSSHKASAAAVSY